MPILVQPFASRSTVSEEVEGLRICIPAKWSWALLFPAAWLCAWTVGGVAAGLSLFRHFSFFVCIWMVGWAVGELMVGYIVLYAIGGRELILVNSETITCTTQIFGLGRAKSYRVGEMRNLRFQPEVSVGKSRIASRIAFDYGAKTAGFGAGIDEAEAPDLISRIRQRCAILDGSAPQACGIKFWQPR
jgi:hypothetical protein